MRILLLSAYAARSHVAWREALQTMLPEHEFTVLELPPRHFNWRVRGNPLHWALAETKALTADYDLLLATSMVDLATLRGLVPALASLPSLLYFHENQFAYPASAHQTGQVEVQMVSIYSALAADRLAFNSCFNRDSFLDGVSTLLRRLPDKVPSGIVDRLRARSQVLPVPFSSPARRDAEKDRGASAFRGSRGDAPETLRILWVGRLEYDKGCDRLPAFAELLEQSGVDFELAVVGQEFRERPASVSELQNRFGHRLVHVGYLPSREDYLATLLDADVVVSTALHEFQGLAVLEAVSLCCLPIVPNRQVYSEWFDAEFLYEGDTADATVDGRAAAEAVMRIAALQRAGRVSAPDVSRFSQQALAGDYRDLFADTSALASPAT